MSTTYRIIKLFFLIFNNNFSYKRPKFFIYAEEGPTFCLAAQAAQPGEEPQQALDVDSGFGMTRFVGFEAQPTQENDA